MIFRLVVSSSEQRPFLMMTGMRGQTLDNAVFESHERGSKHHFDYVNPQDPEHDIVIRLYGQAGPGS